MTSRCNGQDSIVGISLVKVRTFKVIQGNAHSSILRKPRGEKAGQPNTPERLLQSTTEGPHLQGHPRLHLCLGLPAPSYLLVWIVPLPLPSPSHFIWCPVSVPVPASGCIPLQTWLPSLTPLSCLPQKAAHSQSMI